MLRSALAVTLLAALVVGLILDGLRLDRARDTRSLRLLQDVAQADTELQRDVLLVRAGLLRDYDPLVAQTDRMNAGLARLRADVRRDDLGAEASLALSRAAAGEEALVERFKSDQALVRNSLAFLPILVARVGDPADPQLAGPVQALSRSVMSLLLDDSGEAAAQTQARIDALATLSAADPAMLHHLVEHAQLLQRMMPRVDALLHDIASTPIEADIAVVRGQIEARAARLQHREHRLGIALSLVSLLLVVLTARILLNLRASRRELEERVAIERMTAGISALFVGCQPEQIIERLSPALATVGRQTGLDRVSVVLSDPEAVVGWARGDEDPPAWLGPLLLEVASEAAAEADGDMLQGRPLAAIAGPATRRLAATGTRGWVGFRLRRQQRMIGLLSFEATRRSARWPRPGIASLRPVAHLVEEALERERVAREREALRARLNQAQRLEAAGALASGLAHNFNNIVGAVIGHAELAADCLARSTSPSEHVDEIRRAAERAGELVETMLSLGRRDVPRHEVKMSALAEETISLLLVSLPAGVTLDLKDEAAGTTVIGRPAELQQVILNLVRNAAQASSERGHVEVRLARVGVIEPRSMRLGLIAPGEYLVITVSDDGRGMDAATLGRIFEPFFTTRPAGTGLGLATVADIVREHGGGIDARSTPGAGSVFEAWLPCGAGVPVGTSIRRGQGEIILLLVEGDRERLFKLEDLLAALGYEPAGFPTAAQAIEALRMAGSNYDAIVIDVASRQDGTLDTAASLRAAAPDLPTLVLGENLDLSHLAPDGRSALISVESRLGAAGLASRLSALMEQPAAAPRDATT